MNSLGKVSAEEILATIRYLDPDFQDNLKIEKRRRTASRSRRWLFALGVVILLISVVLFIAVLRYPPAVMRLLN